ncbi:MAG: hypothetical protein MJZ52_07175 [Bacteroidales bacterium]|nr:hypothetical protein [Bacteroidales bacterium]
MNKVDNAIRVIKTEMECVSRQPNGCDRDCGHCDLVLQDKTILDGYNTALEALQELKTLQKAFELACEFISNDDYCVDNCPIFEGTFDCTNHTCSNSDSWKTYFLEEVKKHG